MGKIKIVVASKNPVKINAVRDGFLSFFEDIETEGVDVGSGVSDQPMSDKETKKGAQNRAAKAKKIYADADFWIGIEGGIEVTENKLSAFAWVVILSNKKYGESRTASFLLPEKVARLIADGHELGIANDIVFNQKNSKQKHGAVGLLTNNKINRTGLYIQAIMLALIPFTNPDLF